MSASESFPVPAAQPDTPSNPGSPPNSVDPQSVEGLFLAALQKTSPEERAAYLDEVCGGDEDRRRRVAALLRAYEDAGSFLETPAGGRRNGSDDAELRLDFLSPTDKPGCLGVLGPYEIIDVIGRGGMGIVLRALDPKLNRIVAVKVLAPELAAHPNARKRFLREAQAAAAVSHPHVVTIHAVEDGALSHLSTLTSQLPYLVMECVVGQSLQEKLDKAGSLTVTEILRIAHQIACGLAAAHKQGLIHRDIKPANILLENGVERVKITDFGLARLVDDVAITRTGEVSGTPQYMSPEQAKGERVDARSDLFSLGCVMYAMCTGHSPFRGDSLAHVIQRVTQDAPRPIEEQNPEIPRWLVQVVNRLLEKSPDQRYQTASDVAELLGNHLARLQHAPVDSSSHVAINARHTPPRRPAALPRVRSTGGSNTAVALPAWAQLSGRVLIALGAVVTISGVISLLIALTASSPPGELVYLANQPGILVLGLLAMILGVVLLRRTMSPEGLLILLAVLFGPLGIAVWIARREAWQRQTEATPHRPATLPDDETPQWVYRLRTAGTGLLLTGAVMLVWPLALILFGVLNSDGDPQEFGGNLLTLTWPFTLLALLAGGAARIAVWIMEPPRPADPEPPADASVAPPEAGAGQPPAPPRTSLRRVVLAAVALLLIVPSLMLFGRWLSYRPEQDRERQPPLDSHNHVIEVVNDPVAAVAEASEGATSGGESADPFEGTDVPYDPGESAAPLPPSLPAGVTWRVDPSVGTYSDGKVNLTVQILDPGLLVALRRNSLFGATIDPEETLVTRIGDSSLRVAPGHYELLVRDDNFGWGHNLRGSVTIREQGVGTLSIARDLSATLHPDVPRGKRSTTFRWNGESYTNLSLSHFNVLVTLTAAFLNGSPDVAEETLLLALTSTRLGWVMRPTQEDGQVRYERIVQAVPDAASPFGTRRFPTPADEDVIRDSPYYNVAPPQSFEAALGRSLQQRGLIVPGETEGTFRLAPIPKAIVRFTLDAATESLTWSYPDHAGWREFYSDGHYVLEVRPGTYHYTFVPAHPDVAWLKPTWEGHQAIALPRSIDAADGEDIELDATLRLTDAVQPRTWTQVLNDPSQHQYLLRWYGFGNFDDKEPPHDAFQLNAAQAAVVGRLLQALSEGHPDVVESELLTVAREAGALPPTEAAADASTGLEPVFPGLSKGDWTDLLIAGESPETWRLHVPPHSQ